MTEVDVEKLGIYLEDWARLAPSLGDVDTAKREGMQTLIEAGMVQYRAEGWDFKLHEEHPDAPRSQLKLMIREAPGVDTSPYNYDRFVLPAVLEAKAAGRLEDVDYVLGYPAAGTAIARAFARLVRARWGNLSQIEQEKINHPDGRRELGRIISPYEAGKRVMGIDDVTTGGDTKIEGWRRIVEHGLGYVGLILIVERDPLGTALVRQRTGAEVWPSMHWMTLVKQAVQALDLPKAVEQREIDYARRLFEWNVAHNNFDGLPDPAFLRPVTAAI